MNNNRDVSGPENQQLHLDVDQRASLARKAWTTIKNVAPYVGTAAVAAAVTVFVRR